MSTNVRLTMPAEPTTSRRSRINADPLSFGLVNAWNGKSPIVNVVFGRTAVVNAAGGAISFVRR
jgi:hypothetical protein